MARLKPEKLSVEFRDGITPIKPIIPRKYTLTHSDATADIFLTIGSAYAYDKTNAMRDEVLGEWVKIRKNYLYYICLQLDGQLGELGIAIRDYIFTRELPLALEAIRYGDRKFFRAHPKLNYVPIIIYFVSANPLFNRMENWGNFMDYEI